MGFLIGYVRNLLKSTNKIAAWNGFLFLNSHLHNTCVSVFQVPDNAVMALVPKQVTAYNSVNNSTVSRTSASKYGKMTGFCISSSFSSICVRETLSQEAQEQAHW